MDNPLLDQLTNATTDDARQLVVLEMILSRFPTADLREALTAAAVPHWFDFDFLSALIGENQADETYDFLLEQSFVDRIPGRGYTVHERTRKLLLDQLWQTDGAKFKELSQRAANYCLNSQESGPWRAEEIYHRLVSNPQQGIGRFQEMATEWANFEHSSYEEIEQVTNLADEQINGGRLTGAGANWVRLWQARLALLYNQPAQANRFLEQISASEDLSLAADVAQVRGDIGAAENDLQKMTGGWEQAIKHYDELNRPFDRYLVEEKLRGREQPIPPKIDWKSDTGSFILPSKVITDRFSDRFRTKLLDNIENGWINGVLREVFESDDQPLDLPLAKGDGTQTGQSRLQIHRPDGVDQSLKSASGLRGLFEASGRSLLVLGAPGSGKTIALLQLLDQLIQHARQNKEQPIPLLFNLSSFGNFDGEFIDWLTEQAHDQYRLNRQTVIAQLKEGGYYTLLLDGLDEVPNETGARDNCVAAINQFTAEHPAGLVVCSRISDYRSLGQRLDVEHAVVLQPLTNRQITNTLEANGHSQLLSLVKSDWRLREALRSPLLLNLFPQAGDAASFANKQINSIDGWRKEIFAQYADKCLSAADDGAPHRAWLGLLAQGMQKAGTTVFNIEDLQTAWLPEHRLIGRYRWWAGVVLGFALGPIFGISLGIRGGMRWTLDNNLYLVESSSQFMLILMAGLILGTIGGIIVGAASGLFFGFVGGVSNFVTKRLARSLERRILGGIIATSFILIFGGTVIESVEYGFLLGLVGRIAAGSGVIATISILCGSGQIQLKDRVRLTPFDTNKFRQNAPAIVGIYLFLEIVGSLAGPIFEFGSLSIYTFLFTFLEILPISVITALICGLGLTLLDSPPIDEPAYPGKGVRSSLRNGLLMVTLSAIVFGVTGTTLDFWYKADGNFVNMILALILPLVFYRFGGLDWAKHIGLRLVVWWNRLMPFKLESWLDQQSDAGLLRRVGGGYIFIHRSLLEYFAENAGADVRD